MVRNVSIGKRFVTRITRMLEHGTAERYTLSSVAARRIGEMVDEAARGEHAVEIVGAVLKLIHVLRINHASPSAAARLTDVLQRSSKAMRIVALHWSGGRGSRRVGADLMPVKTGLAPHVEATPPAGVRASSFIAPGNDLRSTHLQRRIMRRKS